MKNKLIFFYLAMTLAFSAVAEETQKVTNTKKDTPSAKFEYTNGDKEGHVRSLTTKEKTEGKVEVKATKLKQNEIFQVGTGTRGGGSGAMTAEGKIQVLEVYRSLNREIYQDFFRPDKELIEISNTNSPEVSAQLIFEKILTRLEPISPNLTKKIQAIANDIPFSKWIPAKRELNLIEDHEKLDGDESFERIQLAYRRAHYIFYQQTAYEQLDGLNRAALWLHEYLYALSGEENSLKTQRAVSLFFSNDFLEIAQDEKRLTILFYEMGLLSLSRAKITMPSGAKISEAANGSSDICGSMEKLEADAATKKATVYIRTERGLYRIPMSASKTITFMNAMFWSKDYLSKQFPLFKYPSQMIGSDQVCISFWTAQVKSFEVSIINNPSMVEADLESAGLEVKLVEAQNKYIDAMRSDSQQLTQLRQTEMRLAELRLESALNQVKMLQAVSIFKLLQDPPVLGKIRVEVD